MLTRVQYIFDGVPAPPEVNEYLNLMASLPRRVCHNTLALSLMPPVPKEETARRALLETPISAGGLMLNRFRPR